MTTTDSLTSAIAFESPRAERKAQRREEIRNVAQQLFDHRGFDAVTIAEIAEAAGISVQTVFNHFTAKEELFFDGRTPWVDGPALAVQSRPWHVSPHSALRDHLVEGVWETVHREATPEGRRYIAAIQSSPALRAYERELVHQSQRLLSSALAVAWTENPPASTASLPDDPVLSAVLAAATLLAPLHEVVVAQRALDDPPQALASRAAVIADHLLHRLSSVFGFLACPLPSRAGDD
ncbi:TetR/AcrR family transcriptional regulator [Blastococcus sp. PRF04-17]|uniref:TetR/AcrR family transcriptional regulator n=1 Tax=Blastococcus sp. PRF04-17 TaxID=2933797 RepID=UPI001FF4C23E|nr:TetR/AcrR family transcriptional regulator [Blastococcus sp. PRF04-17]UOY02462.1 TetR/AcrR family transcriptional regulator [Blastococcus sp. PRF04-17]